MKRSYLLLATALLTLSLYSCQKEITGDGIVIPDPLPVPDPTPTVQKTVIDQILMIDSIV